MKSLIFSLAFLLTANQLFSQDLSIARIWKNYEFSAKGAGSYQMLNDGDSYTELDEKGNLVKRAFNESVKAENITSG